LDQASRTILDHLQGLMTTNTKLPNSNPQEALLAARAVNTVARDIVFASDSNSVVVGARQASANAENLLKKTFALALSPNIPDKAREGLLNSSSEAAKALSDLLLTAKLSKKDPKTMDKLQADSAKVTQALRKVVENLRVFPGAQDLQLESEDDLEAMAEAELRKCAKNLEIVSKNMTASLSNTPASVSQNQKEISVAIVTASNAIVDATKRLVINAEQVQGERISASARSKEAQDNTWANGILRGVKSINTAIADLARASEAAAQGKLQTNDIVNSANAVAQATAQLVNASKSADPNSKSGQALSAAAKQVANAVAKLVEAAQKASKLVAKAEADSATNFEANDLADRQRLELEQQMKIAQLEVELERERRTLNRMMKGMK